RMLMNRRAMLTYSMATVALTLTGCKKRTTIIVVYNRTNLDFDEETEETEPNEDGGALRINAFVDGGGKIYKFNKNRIKLGGSAQQKYAVKGAVKGDVADLNITLLRLLPDLIELPFDPNGLGLQVVVGYK